MSSVPYTLRVGVTGHRSLESPGAVEAAARLLFERLRAALGDDSCAPVQWKVVSALALGADRCVARAAMQSLDAALEVITPMPLDEYRHDFAGEADRAEFEALLQLGTRDEADDDSTRTNLADPEQRNLAYLNGGHRMVDVCEIVIAVWNGQKATGTGGTADIVRYALEQQRLVLWLHAAAPESPAQMIRSAAIPRHDEVGAPTIDAVAVPLDAKLLSPALHQHRAYCGDTAIDTTALQEAAQSEFARLNAAAAALKAPLLEQALEPVARSIVPHFVRADLLANHYQRCHTRALAGVLYLGAAAITIALAELLFLPGTPWLVMLDALAMACALGLWLWSRQAAWHEKWLHDRYLAEHLRILLFTTLAQMPIGPPNGADRLPFYRGPRQWLPAMLNTIASAAVSGSGPHPAARAIADFADTAWLQQQEAYNSDTAQAKHDRAHRRHRLELVLLGTAFLAAVLHAFGVGHGAGAGLRRWAQLEAWISFIGLALIPWAGVVHATTSQLELDKIAVRSRRMAKYIQRIRRDLRAASSHAEVQRLINRAAELMTSENHEWWVLLSFQEMRLHA